MPIFEFVCTECGEPFEELVRSALFVDGVICPACQSTNVSKKISNFAASSNSGNSMSSYSSGSSCYTGST
jgi:putative FmdB family regulatory protein